MPVFCAEFQGQLAFVQSRLPDLEGAMPQEKATWRPSEGVRSVSEVYLHTAFSNYLFLKFAGLDIPEDIKPQLDMQKWESQTTDRTKIKQIMERSFAEFSTAVDKLTEEDLETTVNAFGMDMSLRSFMVSSLAHLHEHLGQSIAYTRMNGVVPPWTAKEQLEN